MPLSPGIELRHLRYFLAVYDELHFGRAARKLHIAQPPLSHAIRKLEQELGAEVLERTSRTVKPTAAGHVLAVEARKVLASFDFAIAETRGVADGAPPLRVGWVTYLAPSRLKRFLSALTRHDTHLRPEVTHQLGLQQVDSLRSGALDLGVFAHAEDYEGLEWERLYPGEDMRLFVAKSHRLAAKSSVKPGDVWDQTLLTYDRAVNPPFYDSVMGALQRAGYRFPRRHETEPDPRNTFMGAAYGLGVAIAPRSFELANYDVVGIPMDPPLSYPTTIVAWRADPPRQLSERLDAIRKAASELFRSTALQVEPT